MDDIFWGHVCEEACQTFWCNNWAIKLLQVTRISWKSAHPFEFAHSLNHFPCLYACGRLVVVVFSIYASDIRTLYDKFARAVTNCLRIVMYTTTEKKNWNEINSFRSSFGQVGRETFFPCSRRWKKREYWWDSDWGQLSFFKSEMLTWNIEGTIVSDISTVAVNKLESKPEKNRLHCERGACMKV